MRPIGPWPAATRPASHLPAGHEGPIDFYRDYIAHGYLITGDGVRIDGPTASDPEPLP